jgi:hypothetical protein
VVASAARVVKAFLIGFLPFGFPLPAEREAGSGDSLRRFGGGFVDRSSAARGLTVRRRQARWQVTNTISRDRV